MKPRIRAALLVISIFLCRAIALSQVLLEGADATKVIRILDTLPSHDTLKCTIHDWKPFLDFSFRFEAGYFVRCPFDEFDGREARVAAYVRVIPQGGSAVVMADLMLVPAVPAEVVAKTNLKRLHAELDMSGGFAVGEGSYQVDVLITDNRNRFCRKRWSIKTERNRGQADIPVALKGGTVSHIWPDPWDGKLVDKGHGYRVTILLDAMPMNPREAKLRVWDRAFLMQSLGFVLQHLPCESVKLVAFNLDQQKELYRKENFDTDAFRELSRTLRTAELGTVSYKSLQRGPQSVTFLAAIARREMAAQPPSDVVIFIGPTVHISQKAAKGLGNPRHGTHFFYFEYFPFSGPNFPDSIQHLTTALDGTTYQIHSPAELSKAMQKMLAVLDREGGASNQAASPTVTPRN